MAKVSVNLDDDLDGDDSARKLKELSAPLPSVSKAKSTALKDAPRVQFSFTNVPKPIKDHCVAVEGSDHFHDPEYLIAHCVDSQGYDRPLCAKSPPDNLYNFPDYKL